MADITKESVTVVDWTSDSIDLTNTPGVGAVVECASIIDDGRWSDDCSSSVDEVKNFKKGKNES